MLKELLDKIVEQKIMGTEKIMDFIKNEYGNEEALAFMKLTMLLMF